MVPHRRIENYVTNRKGEKMAKNDNRMAGTIGRAVREFGFEINPNVCMDELFADAIECIEGHVSFDYISECEVSGGHLSWNDGKGFQLEADGQFIADDREFSECYRKNEQGEYEKIAWYDTKEGDFVRAYDAIDSDGVRALLVWKIDY
jgi:hypothetical protein